MRTAQRIGLAVSAGLLITGIAGCGGQAATQAPPPPGSKPTATADHNTGSGARRQTATQLDGTYTVNWRLSELAKALGGRWEAADEYSGNLTATFHGDDFWFNGLCHGKSEVTGHRVVVKTTANPSEWDCGAGPGAPMVDARWTVDGDTLRLTDWHVSSASRGTLDWNLWVILGFKPLHRMV